MSRCVIVLCFGECRMETFLITTAGSAVVDGLVQLLNHPDGSLPNGLALLVMALNLGTEY